MYNNKRIMSVAVIAVLFINTFLISMGNVFAVENEEFLDSTKHYQTNEVDGEKSNQKEDKAEKKKDDKEENNKEKKEEIKEDSKDKKEKQEENKIKEDSGIIVVYKDLQKSDKVKTKVASKNKISQIKSKRISEKLKIDKIEIQDEETRQSILEDLNNDPDVLYAQPDYILESFDLPEGEHFENQWALLNEGQTVGGQKGIAGVDINIHRAWDISKGSEDVIVAVIDTGIDISHPEISNSIFVNENEKLNGKDTDNNSLIDDINGWDFVNNDNSVYDSPSFDVHGSHIAGIIAANINKNAIAGVAPNTTILPVKFIEGNVGRTSDAIAAIDYASSMGATIFNCSWGSIHYNQALKDVIEKTEGLFICAAGNSAKDSTIEPIYPASYDLDNIISVGAIDNRGVLAPFSNYGANVDIAAPGVSIISTIPEGEYGYLNGTSFAAPYVAGVAALIKSTDSNLSLVEIKERILNNVSKSQKLSGKTSTSGWLNAEAALLNEPPEESDESDEEFIDEDWFTVEISGINAKPGQEVEIPIKISNLPKEGICAFDFIADYDNKKMTYKGFEAGELTNTPDASINVGELSNGIKVLYVDESKQFNQPISESGEIVKLIFELDSSFDVAQITFGNSWNFIEMREGNEIHTIVDVLFKPGFISTGNYSLSDKDTYANPERLVPMHVGADGIGDLNGDGYFNSTDCALMYRYIIEIIDTFPVEDDYWAGDVMASGTINSTDYNMMQRVLTKIVDEFPKSRMLPTPPTNLEWSTNSNSDVVLTWGESYTEESSLFEGYKIYVDEEEIGSTSDLTYTITDLDSSDSHSVMVTGYSISSYNVVVESSPSNEVEVVFDAGMVSVDFDKTTASVGEIITGEINIENMPQFSGYQIYISYDPKVIRPVKDDLSPFEDKTFPSGKNVITYDYYNPMTFAGHDLYRGVLGFGAAYTKIYDYRDDGIVENGDTLGIIKFEVLKENMIEIKVEADKLDISDGISFYDLNGYKIEEGYILEQPDVINENLPVFEPQSVDILSETNDEKPVRTLNGNSYKISGYVEPDFQYDNTELLSGFIVELYVNGNDTEKEFITGEDGYFEIENVEIVNGQEEQYTLKISKEYYVTREIKHAFTLSDLLDSNEIKLGTQEDPIKMWGGDIVDDNALNMDDTMRATRAFNTVPDNPRFDEVADINKDNAVDLEDIAIIVKNFNKTWVRYPQNGSLLTRDLEEDMVLQALDMDRGTINLNGYELTIEGDFNQSGGTVNLNGGRLIVNGNYFIGNTQSGVPSSGKLIMTNKSDYIKVNGDFLMYSSQDHTGLLTEGTLETTGSFTQKYGGSASNFPASGYHKVKLAGRDTSIQTVSFDNAGSSKINILEVRYPIEFYNLIDTGVNPQSAFSNNGDINSFSISTLSENPFYERLVEEFGNDVVNRVTTGVSTADGSFSYSAKSMNVKLVGFDLSVGANYNSKEKESKMLGSGWTFSHEGWMDIEDHGQNGNLIKVMLPGGEVSYFVHKNGDFTPKGTRNTLSLENGIYILTTKNQEKYGYELYESNKYRIKWMRDRYCNQLDFGYDSSNRLNNISDSIENSISIGYTENRIDVTHIKSSRKVSYVLEGGLLKEIIDPMSIKTTFSYDSNNCLEKVWDNNGDLIDSLKYKKGSSGKYVVDTYVDAFGNEKEYTYYENENKTVVGENILSGRVVQIAAGWYHTVALMGDGTVMVWGHMGFGALGLGDTGYRDIPTQVDGLNNVKQIAAGYGHTVALMGDGTVMAWGYNLYGQLGLGDNTDRTRPTQVDGLNNVKQIVAGVYHTAALKKDGTVMAWGANGTGQLGLGTYSFEETRPRQIEGLNKVKQIAARHNHTAALKEDGTVMAWGSNWYGQLGLGDTTSRNIPTQVNGLNNVKQIAAGNNHTVALMENGTVMAWGNNEYGQLGLGDNTDRTIPTQVDGLNNVKQIVAGWDYTLAIMQDGTVMAWGINHGQLGLGDTTDRKTPTLVNGLNNVKQLAAGYEHAVALKEDGTVMAWGINVGKLGLGDTTHRTTPTLIPSLSSTLSKTTTYLHKDYRVTKIIDPLEKSTYYSYNKFGELESYTDRNGNRTQYIINQSTGNVEKIMNPDLSQKEFGYDSKNNLIWEKDEEGFFTRYVYDSDGINLRKKAKYMEKLGANEIVDLTEQNASKFAITEYLPYTDSNNIKLKGVVHKIKDPLGNVTTYHHYEDGNIKEIWEPDEENHNAGISPIKYEYNNMGLKEHEYSSRNQRSDYTYNANGQIESIVVNNADGVYVPITESSTIKIGYDNMGRMNHKLSPKEFSERFPEEHSNSGYRYEYYKSGKLWKEIDPESNVTTYIYDQFGNLKTEKRSNGSAYHYNYDLLNRLTEVYFQENVGYDKTLVEEYIYPKVFPSDRNGNYYETKMIHREYFSDDYAETTYNYDYAGRVIRKKLPDNTTIEKEYYKNGSLNWSRDGRGNVTYFSYDKYDGNLNTTYDEVWVPSVNENGTVKYSYKRVDYDKAARKVSESTGKSFVIQGAPSDFITYTYTYYNSGKLRAIGHEGEWLKEYKYDADWNLVEEIRYKEPSIMTSPKKSIIRYENINYLGKPKEEIFITEQENIILNTGDNTKTYTQYPDSIGLVTTYTYDKNGNIKTETAPNGVTTTYSYDMMNRLKKTSMPGINEYEDSVTVVTETRYNWEGKVEYTKDANGNEIEHIYNQRGLLSETKNSVTTDNETTDIISAYQYDRSGRLIAEVEPKYYNSEIRPIDTPNRIEYTYDKMGRLKTKEFVGIEMHIDPEDGFSWIEVPVRTVQRAYQYDSNGNLVKELDALGYAAGTGNSVDEKIESGYGTEYTYTLNNLEETVLDPESKLRGLEYSVKYEYDPLGRKTHEINVKGSNPENKFETITRYEYDDLGNLEFIYVDDDIIQRNNYDFVGNIISQTDANNNTTSYKYNALNQVTKVIYPGDESIDSDTITYWYDVVGNLVKEKNSLNNVNLYTYDNQERLLTHTSQKGEGENAEEIITTFLRYDLNGNIRFEVDGNGYEKEYIYDEINRLSQTRMEDVNTEEGRLVNHTTTYRYDLNDNLELTIETIEDGSDSISRTYTNVYDPLNRLIEKRNPDNVAVEKLEYNINNSQIRSYNALNNIAQYDYDRNNRLIETIDAEEKVTTQGYDLAGNIGYKEDGLNHKTIYTYDKFDRLEKVEGLESGKTARKLLSTYTYDLNGNMEAQTDGKGNTITYEYNARNLLSKRIDPDGRTGESGAYTYDNTKIESYKYYGDENLKEKIDKKSIKTTYTYDSHERIKTQNTNGDNPVSVNYTYDDNGNTLTVSTDSEVITRTYDELNRVTTKTVTNIGQSRFEYDIIYDKEKGYVAEKLIDPKGNINTKVYDRIERLKYVKDGDVDSTVYATYTYYDNGSRESVIYPDGSKEVYTYYDNNLLWTLTNRKSDGSDMDVYTYTYDNANNQNTKHEIINGVNKETTIYSYDYLNRLESVTEPNGRRTEYEYDAAGNRETETIIYDSIETVKTYVYNNQNWLQSVNTKLNGNTLVSDSFTYTYDDNGNQTHVRLVSDNHVVSEYTYDDLNQLISSNSNENIVYNTYNGEGLRVAKSVVNGSLTRYLYEYDKVVLEVVIEPGQADKVNRNLYGTNLLMRTVDNESYYYMYNGHADVTALINVATGTVEATYYYDSFGNILESTGAAKDKNSIRYAGYQWDEETELYYLNARMYDPKIARFLQEDTYRGDPNDPLTLNLYAYTANNPIKYYDPTGHFYTKTDTFMGENTYMQKVYEYDLETGELVYKNRDIYLPKELLDRTKLADGSTVYAIRPYFSANLDTVIGSDIAFDYFEKYILDESDYVNFAPAYTLFLTWAEDSYYGDLGRFENFVVGGVMSLFNSASYGTSIIASGCGAGIDQVNYYFYGYSTNLKDDLWRKTREGNENINEWVKSKVYSQKSYELGHSTVDILQTFYAIHNIAKAGADLPNAIKKLKNTRNFNTRNFNTSSYNFIDPYTGFHFSEIPTDFGSMNIPAISRNALQANYWKAITNNQGTSKTFWGSWDDYEKVAVKVNGQEHTYAKVGDRLYSKHAVDRMQPSANRYGHSITQAGGDYGRSVAPQYVEDVINSVKPIVQENGNLKYIGGSLEVITNPQGAVVTIMTK